MHKKPRGKTPKTPPEKNRRVFVRGIVYTRFIYIYSPFPQKSAVVQPDERPPPAMVRNRSGSRTRLKARTISARRTWTPARKKSGPAGGPWPQPSNPLPISSAPEQIRRAGGPWPQQRTRPSAGGPGPGIIPEPAPRPAIYSYYARDASPIRPVKIFYSPIGGITGHPENIFAKRA